MNRFIKQIAVAALVITTVGAGTTMQAQAGSSFGRTLLGVAAAGVIINEVKKNRAHNNRSYQRNQVRSQQRKRYRGNHRSNYNANLHRYRQDPRRTQRSYRY
ncbi:MAG: hypothetical protein ABJL67_21460 [Sulfitobacter sp.]